jgi:hypothetical protein
VSVSKTDISKIRSYLNGELDARAMYELELRAQNDPFLMDVMMGMEAAEGNQQPHLDDLTHRLKQRTEKDERRIVPIFKFKYWAAAASILLTLSIGSWWLFRQSPQYAIENNMAKVMPPEKRSKSGSPVVVQAPDEVKMPVRQHQAIPLPGKAQKRKLVTPPSVPVDSVSSNEVTLPIAANKNAVIRGYVTRDLIQQKDLSYSTYGKAVQDNPVGNVEQLLQGKVAGLNIQNNSGAPGMRGSVNIRGLSTNTGNTKDRVISGTVVDTNTGEPLPGATIGTSRGALTQTDVNGKFIAVLPAAADSVMVSYLSYKSQLLALRSTGENKIALTPENQSLNEVAIRGYVKRNREQTTGSSYIITGKEVQDSNPDNKPPQFHGGKIPGKFLPINPVKLVKPLPCVENLRFKQKFFDKIALVEQYVIAKNAQQKPAVSEAKFFRGLKFIAEYTKVSVDIKGKNNYTDIEAFRRDKANWLNWYEANKCSALK